MKLADIDSCNNETGRGDERTRVQLSRVNVKWTSHSCRAQAHQAPNTNGYLCDLESILYDLFWNMFYG